MSDAGGRFHFYDFTVLVRDLDPQAHMANHVYVAYLSEARARFLSGFEGEAGTLRPSVVAEVGCTYLSPLVLHDPFRVGVRVARVGRTSVGFEYEIRTAERLAARARSVEVLVDADTRRPREVPDDLRRRLVASSARGASAR
ncbi:MAG TPA: thioesterase family protein [Candidatus Binatia bacterium]|nr:thioesterase family protein [Candidatus Binatia bacterium]